MKIEQALKEAANIPKAFHSKQGKKLLTNLKREFNSGKDVRGKSFVKLSKGYRKRKMSGKASPLQVNYTGKADMKLTGGLLNSSYFKNLKFINKNSWQTTTGNTLEGTKALAHSGKIKRPKGLPIRPIIGDREEDNVVHPRLKKKFIESYAKYVFGQLKRIPKKEFL